MSRVLRSALAVLALATALTPAVAGAADFFVDPVNGNDTTGDGTPANPWKSITKALATVDGPGAVIHAAAGMYQRPAESLPIAMKPGVSLVGAGAGRSILREDRTSAPDRPTVIFCARPTGVLCPFTGQLSGSFSSSDVFQGFTVERNAGVPGGIGVSVTAEDASASPTITRNEIRNYRVGVQAFSGSYNATTTTSPVVNGNVIVGASYTAGGNEDERMWILAGLVSYGYMGSPDKPSTESTTFTNNLVLGKHTGLFTGTGCAYPAPSATKLESLKAQPTITNNTIVGAGLDGIYLAAIDTDGLPSTEGKGHVTPALQNNLLSGNGRWGVREGASHSDPTLVQVNDFDRNAQGPYLRDGSGSLTVPEVNATFPGGGNVDLPAGFVDAAAGDYHLAAGAGPIDAGAATGAPGDDQDGHVRPQDGDGAGGALPDIGHDEYVPCVAVASTAGSETSPPCGGPATLDGRQSTVDPACTSGLTYAWYRGTTLLSTDSVVQVSTFVPTTYTLRVVCSDPVLSTCRGETDVLVTPAAGPTADAGTDHSIALGGRATLGGSPTASGGTPGYSYLWTPAAPGLSSTTEPNPLFTPQSAGDTVFTVRVTDSLGCSDTDNVRVSVAGSGPVVADAGGPFTTPYGDAVVLGGNPAGSGGTPPLHYAWTPPDGLSATDVANPVFTPSGEGLYSFALTVTDDIGGSAQDVAEVTVQPPPAVVADAGPDASVTPDTPVVLGGSPAGSGGHGALAYEWTPAPPELSDPSVPNPTFRTGVAGNYDFTLRVQDSIGQSATDAVRVVVKAAAPPVAANAGADRTIPLGGTTVLGGDAVIPTATAGTPPYRYVWTPAGGLSAVDTANPVFTPAATGLFTYEVTVTDSRSERATDSVTITVEDAPPGTQPGEVRGVQVEKRCVTDGWLRVRFQAAVLAERHRLWRGTIQWPWRWDHANPPAPAGCDEMDGGLDPDAPLEFRDTDACGAGSLYFLVAGVNAAGEGTLGETDPDANPATPGVPREELYTPPPPACP